MRPIALIAAIALSGCGADDPGPQEPVRLERPADGKGDTATTPTQNDPTHIDRMGHVEVGPLIIADMDIADRWNVQAPFGLALTDEDWIDFEFALRRGLIRYDHYDSYPLEIFDLRLDTLRSLGEQRDQEIPDPSVLDWFDDLNTPHPLTEVLLVDALYVDLSKPCPAGGGYLEPELATLAGVPYETCGGRHLDEDVIDTFATVLINGPAEREVRDEDDDAYPDRGDSVEAPYQAIEPTFPYLGAPYRGWDEGIF